MLNFDEELKKFQPSLEVEQVEDAVCVENSVDITDLINELVKKQ